jgi:hypothetical protein
MPRAFSVWVGREGKPAALNEGVDCPLLDKLNALSTVYRPVRVSPRLPLIPGAVKGPLTRVVCLANPPANLCSTKYEICLEPRSLDTVRRLPASHRLGMTEG